jgi:hypothetical protein
MSVLATAFILQHASASDFPSPERADFIARRAERFSQTPAPRDPFDKLQSLYGTWKTQDFLQIPTPAWTSEVPEVERKALKEALQKPATMNLDVAKELLIQARRLKVAPETRISAERLFVLAAREGAYDLEALLEISRSSSDTALRERARKLAILAPVIGSPYESLFALDLPLPDLAPYKGSPVAIVLGATWNPNFLVKWPQTKQNLQALKEAGFKITGINFDPEEEMAATFIENERIEWPSIYPKGDPTRFSSEYGVRSLPALWIVDEQGNVVSTQVSFGVHVRPTVLSKP